SRTITGPQGQTVPRLSGEVHKRVGCLTVRGTRTSMEKALSSRGARNFLAEVCAPPRRRRRRSIRPIFAPTRTTQAFARLPLEPECGGRSDLYGPSRASSLHVVDEPRPTWR